MSDWTPSADCGVLADVKRAALTGLAFAAGFLVLAGLWWFCSWPVKPGLFDYRSATIGYGLLLPAVVALLVRGVETIPPARPGERHLAFAVGVAAVLLTLAVQAA